MLVATQFPPNAWTVSFVGGFGLVVGLTYFGSFFLVPLTGNRFYCRYLCLYGATFGLLNHAGFYAAEMNAQRCVDCRRCDQACDMGIPVWEQGKTGGRVTGLEDCVGCARCVVSCPTDALAIRDVRNLFFPTVRRDATRLLGAPPVAAAPRVAPTEHPANERASDVNAGAAPAVNGDLIRLRNAVQHARRGAKPMSPPSPWTWHAETQRHTGAPALACRA